MAAGTLAEVEAIINTGADDLNMHIIRANISGTYTSYYVQPLRDPPVRPRWVDVTTSDEASTQAAAIVAAMV